MEKDKVGSGIEVLLRSRKSKRVMAISLDPDIFSTDSIKTIIRNQVSSPHPKTIFVNIFGFYDQITPAEFLVANTKQELLKEAFINNLVSVLKGPYTLDIIISDPPNRDRR